MLPGRSRPLLQRALLTLPEELWDVSGQLADSSWFLLIPSEHTGPYRSAALTGGSIVPHFCQWPHPSPSLVECVTLHSKGGLQM